MTASQAAATLIYDGDCAFCTASAQRIASHWHGGAQIKSWQRLGEPRLTELGLTVPDVQSAAWWVDDGGRLYRGHLAIARALIQAGGWRRLAGRAVASRALSWPGALVYRLVARYRYRMPGATDACRVD